MFSSLSPPREGGGDCWRSWSDLVLHLDHGAVVEAEADEELPHVRLGEVDQGRDLLDGPELPPARDEPVHEGVSHAPPPVRRVHADQIDPSHRLGDAELGLAHPAEEEAHEPPVRLRHQRHPRRAERGDVPAAAPVLLPRLAGELLVDADDGVQVAGFHRADTDVGATHRGSSLQAAAGLETLRKRWRPRSAAPSAVTNCGPSGTCTGTPSFSSSATTMPACCATPPMNTTGPSRPTRLSRDSARSARELWIPRRMFSTVTPSETWLMISDSASTAHTLEMAWGLAAPSESGPMSPTDTSRYFAARSRKPPDPAAHFSFMWNSFTLPRSRSLIAREHWAPMSRTCRASGKRVAAPRAPHVRSVIWMSRNGTA